MSAAIALHPSLPYAGTALVAWLFYRRVRQNFGPQAWKPRRSMARLVLVALLWLALAFAALHLTQLALPMLGAATAGALLGWIGLRHTRAEWHAGQRRYTPNAWVGGILTTALAARLLWRFTHGGGFDGAQRNPSGLTLAIAAALLTYSLVHTAGLMWRMRELARHPPSGADASTTN